MSINYAELVNEQNKRNNALLARVEKFDKVLNQLQDCKLSFTDYKLATTYLDEVLDEEQAIGIKGIIQANIMYNKGKVTDELDKLLGISNDDEKVEVKTEVVKKESNVPERILQSDFIKDYEDGMSKQQLADKYDIAPSTVYGYASKLGTKRKQAKTEKEEQTTVELTRGLVRQEYTLTSKSLEDVAKELGVTKFELHDFIAKNGLRRDSKRDQQVYRDTEVQKKKPTPSKAN